MSPKSGMHVGGESDGRVVPTKGSNKDGRPSAESLEGRRSIKENIEQPTPLRTQRRASESRGLLGVREVARKDKRAQFTALLHHVTAGAARKVDQWAARKVDHPRAVHSTLFSSTSPRIGCGNVEISRSVRDFQAPVGIVL